MCEANCGVWLDLDVGEAVDIVDVRKRHGKRDLESTVTEVSRGETAAL